MNDILTKLAAPFPPEKISWRVGSTNGDKTRGMALAYIDARDVQDRLDEVCGIHWQVRTPWSSGERIACEIGVKVGDEWIWRGDGAGSTDVEADKGAFSDAFKRAAVRWGIGRYLYDLDSPWVELKQAGRTHVIADHERERLRKLLSGKAAPDLKAQAEALVKKLKEAKDLFALDAIMEDGRELCQKVPDATYKYIGNLYEQRRTAMERAA